MSASRELRLQIGPRRRSEIVLDRADAAVRRSKARVLRALQASGVGSLLLAGLRTVRPGLAANLSDD
jgi:hypothetical protein